MNAFALSAIYLIGAALYSHRFTMIYLLVIHRWERERGISLSIGRKVCAWLTVALFSPFLVWVPLRLKPEEDGAFANFDGTWGYAGGFLSLALFTIICVALNESAPPLFAISGIFWGLAITRIALSRAGISCEGLYWDDEFMGRLDARRKRMGVDW